MNKIAANPLMITTGEYWLMESSTAGHCLAKDRGEETEVPRHCYQISAGEGGQKADQSRPSHPAALSRTAPLVAALRPAADEARREAASWS